MPRKPHVESSESPFFVTDRCINQEWFKLPLDVVWDVFSRQLHFIKHAYNLKIHAFVLMSNHFHLLVSTPDANLSEAMAYLLREVSRELSRLSGHINRSFSDRFHRTRIESFHHFINCYKYVYQNPLRANICSSVLDYPYSTLLGLLGQKQLIIPIEEDTILFNGDLQKNIEWLNHRSDLNREASMRKALKKNVFSFDVKHKWLVNPLEYETL